MVQNCTSLKILLSYVFTSRKNYYHLFRGTFFSTFFFLAVSLSFLFLLLSNIVDAEGSPGPLDIFTWLFFSARRCRLIENICFANVNMLNIFFLSLVTRTISLFFFFTQSLSPLHTALPFSRDEWDSNMYVPEENAITKCR